VSPKTSLFSIVVFGVVENLFAFLFTTNKQNIYLCAIIQAEVKIEAEKNKLLT